MSTIYECIEEVQNYLYGIDREQIDDDEEYLMSHLKKQLEWLKNESQYYNYIINKSDFRISYSMEKEFHPLFMAFAVGSLFSALENKHSKEDIVRIANKLQARKRWDAEEQKYVKICEEAEELWDGGDERVHTQMADYMIRNFPDLGLSKKKLLGKLSSIAKKHKRRFGDPGVKKMK
jgi:hypothetical protein